MRKVFAIGLSRTGTFSLHQALRLFGYNSIHLGAFPLTGEMLREYDAFTDQAVAMRFRELDESFPHAQFIYTVRDVDQWIASKIRTVRPLAALNRKECERVKVWHQEAFGNCQFMDATGWRLGYALHDRAVRTHFEDRERDLLIMDICAGDGWEKLCPFLRQDVPAANFPWFNRSA